MALYPPRFRSSDLLGRRLEGDFMHQPTTKVGSRQGGHQKKYEYCEKSSAMEPLAHGCAFVGPTGNRRLGSVTREPGPCHTSSNKKCGRANRETDQPANYKRSTALPGATGTKANSDSNRAHHVV
jgi:hypothetical protein